MGFECSTFTDVFSDESNNVLVSKHSEDCFMFSVYAFLSLLLFSVSLVCSFLYQLINLF